jgi:hypothetical protein
MTIPTIYGRDAALREFPELQHLADLRDADWNFLPTLVDGKLIEVHGFLTWPRGWADAVRVRYTTDAAGLRIDCDGGITWTREGTLAEVVQGLISLPAPGDRLAPGLVFASAPKLLLP